MRAHWLATCALATVWGAATAEAQSTDVDPTHAAAPTTPTAADPVAATAASPTTTGGLQEIVVTAQRRTENLQKAAVAVAVVNPAALSRAGIVQPTQLGQLVPALTIQPNGGANTIFFLRGIGNFTVNGYSDPAVAFNYDGVYLGRPTSTAGYFYDLERIEVLKGPQGTVYGRNATGGAINVLPAKPVLGTTSASFTGSYGNYNLYEVTGAVNLALGENSAIRLAGNIRGHDGYLTDGTNDDQGRSVRAQFLTKLGPDLTVRIGADYSHNGGNGAGANYASRVVLNSSRTGYNSIPSGLGKNVGLLDPRAQNFRSTYLYSPINGRFDAPLLTDVYLDNRFYGTEAQIDWRTDAGTLTVVPAARFGHLNNLYDATGSNQYIQQDDRQYSVEARWAGKRVSIFDYLVGFYYFDERVRGNYTFGQQVYNAYQDFTSKTKSYAGFARLTANVTDRLRLVGAIRYTSDRKDFDGAADVITVVCPRPATPAPACANAPILPLTDTAAQLPYTIPARGGRPVPTTGGALLARGTVLVDQPLNKTKPTYRGAVEFDVAPQSLLYASYESGYRSGGYSLSAGHETFQPEYIDAYTVGLKNRFLDNRLQLNVEAFLWKYRNQQVSHSGIDANGVNGIFTDNAGRSTNKGVEVEGQFLLFPKTLLSFDAQYLDAKFKSFVFAVPKGATPPVTGCAYGVNPGNAAQYLINCSGKPGYQAPKWTLNMGAQQTVAVGDHHKLVGTVDTQYRTSRYVGFDYEPWEYVKPTWSTNLTLTFAPNNDRWSIGGFIRNLENNRIVTSAFYLTTGGAGLQLTSPPRTYGLTGSVKF